MLIRSFVMTALAAFAAACGSNHAATASDGAIDSAGSGSDCALADATTATATTSTSGCPLLDRDVSSCMAARTAAGITGAWLKLSCRVTLTATTIAGVAMIEAQADDQPDYKSNYFATTNACHETYTGAIQNPNTLAAQTLTFDFPVTPSGLASVQRGGGVGLALNGVLLFDNQAAPGDDIYQEAATFDRCGGHPQQQGVYHYHGEPYAISDDDDAFIGVMRDGSPIYGREDPSGTIPTDLDAYGGHTGTTLDSPSTAVYHYHLNLQTSTASTSTGDMQWFLTTGMYHLSPGACTGC